MKKIYIYICASAIAIAMAACQDWMNVDPAGVQTTTTFWKSKGDVEGVLGKAYRYLRDAINNCTFIYWGEMRACDLELVESKAMNIRNGNILPTNDLTAWSSAYNIIGMANSVIKYAPTVVEKDASFNEFEMNSIVAEAHFLRALSYFYLVRTFKDVPYVIEPYVNDDAEFLLEKTDGNIILEKEIEALSGYYTYAKERFPVVEDDKGRATRWALYTLTADMSLWLGSSVANSDTSNYYFNLCIASCDSVINGGWLGLKQKDEWFSNFFPGNSEESIFEVQYSNALAQTNSFEEWFATGSATTRRFRASNAFEARANRIIDAENDIRGAGGTWGDVTPGITADMVWKYYGQDTENTVRTGEQNDQNWIIYRFAEVLLMKAEALARTGNTEEAFNLVNRVHQRGGSPSLVNAGNVIQSIVDERSIEFYAEGKRWFDILRVGLYNYNYHADGIDWLITECSRDLAPISRALVLSKMNKNYPDSWYLPINSSELEKNTLLEQNRAYAELGK